MENEFEKACGTGILPGVVLLARSQSGAFEYQWSCGNRSVKDDTGPLKVDTLLRIASASKLIVSICAMQCVERGLVSLDDDVTEFVTELKDIQLLTGYDQNDKPILTDPKNKVTLRNLLSHSSGFTYDMLSPLIVKWREQHGTPLGPPGPKLTDQFTYPLDFEPGSRCIYSPSIDWAGRVVEHLAGQTLEDYMQVNICRPLDLHRMTFFPQQHRDLLIGHANIAVRNEKTGNLEDKKTEYWNKDPEDCFGGSSIFTTASDFFEVMQSLLLDDQRLLSPESLREFMAPQLTRQAKDFLTKNLTENTWFEDWNMGGAYPNGCERDHSLCGMYLVEDLPQEKTPRRPGAVAWAGMPNVYWMIDPKAGICTLYASQVEPTWDKQSKDLLRLFERTMYERMYEAESVQV